MILATQVLACPHPYPFQIILPATVVSQLSCSPALIMKITLSPPPRHTKLATPEELRSKNIIFKDSKFNLIKKCLFKSAYFNKFNNNI
jgi:hypothetical protein